MKRLAQMAGAGFALAGIAVMGVAAVTPAKAWLGQHLLDRAWVQTIQTGQPAKPWSWSDFVPVARVAVPRLGVSSVVLDQSSGAAMAWGPGHVTGTAHLGGPGLAAIAGHRDTHLAFLANVQVGDRVQLTTGPGADRVYRVTQAMVVDSRTWRFPSRFDGGSTLALATCWPFGATSDGPLRFVVIAEAVPSLPTPAQHVAKALP